MLEGKDRVRLSKYASRVLRHRPIEAGVALDERGFMRIDDLLEAARRDTRLPVERADVVALGELPAEPGRKRRFEIEGEFIRAGHGHSIEITGYRPARPSGNVYHATVSAAIEAIRREGLRSMSRQMVHLSYELEITIEAARRRGPDVVVIEVDVQAAVARGVGFFESADPRILLAESVPPECLRVLDGRGGPGR